MNRLTFQRISTLRIRESNALLKAEHWPGAYYLAGYAVECALKACVAKQVKRHDFPDKKLAKDAFTHDLEKLVRLAGLEGDFKRDFNTNEALRVNWATVKDWSEEARYELEITEADARGLYSACTARANGILVWIKKRW